MYVSESFKQTLMEVFNAPYEYWKDSPTRFFFETEKGTEYRVEFGDRGDTTEISFAARDGDSWTTDILNEKDSFRVFATVLAIVLEVVQKWPKASEKLLVRAKATEPSRIRLYRRLTASVSHRRGYEVEESESKETVSFKLTKTNKE